MNVNHLALPTREVLAQQRFYCRYFGFQPTRGDGFLVNREGFILVLDPVEVKQPPPTGLHHGFHSTSHAEVRELYDQMVREGVSVTRPLEQQGPMLTFFCEDPEGYEVEVRAIEAPV